MQKQAQRKVLLEKSGEHNQSAFLFEETEAGKKKTKHSYHLILSLALLLDVSEISLATSIFPSWSTKALPALPAIFQKSLAVIKLPA